jgi:hypothetical protein
MNQVRAKIIALGGVVIGDMIQRRGVFCSKKLGGSKRINDPLDARLDKKYILAM